MVRIRHSARYAEKKQQAVAAVPFEEVIAKTVKVNGNVLPGMTILEHSILTGKIAEHFVNSLPERLQDLFGTDAVLAAACHDIGKVNQYFYCRIQVAVDKGDSPLCKGIIASLNLADGKNPLRYLKSAESAFNYHPGLGYITFFAITHNHYLASVIGRHHGFFKKIVFDEPLSSAGGAAWYTERQRLFHALEQIWPLTLKQDIDYLKALMWSGLVSVSDWISSSELFDKFESDDAKIAAVINANFLNSTEGLIKGLTFQDIFKDPAGQSLNPNDLQQKLSAAIAQGPGLYLVEAPMGNGKTEAALFACYKAMVNGDSRGLYFALPTRVTSNQMFWRVNDFLRSVFGDDNDKANRAFLIHGGADLFLSFAGADAGPGTSWYASGCRKMLAPFAVGTIDQALLGILHVKHAGFRLFSLAGKTVVFDEVHSYDAYTSTLLQKLIAALLEFKCTVIVLSATLTRRAVRNYFGSESFSDKEKYSYPALFYKSQTEKLNIVPLASTGSKAFKVNVVYDEEAEYKKVLQKALQGQQVLWIENNVAIAQQVYMRIRDLAQDAPIECGLLHSRFTPKHRQEKENYWLKLLGKTAQASGFVSGRILVGTQVLEQSLDIDADYLVTRLAPVDFLLQRIGRLWRFNLPERAEEGFLRKLKDFSQNGCEDIGLTGTKQLENCAISASSQDDTLPDGMVSDDLELKFTRYGADISQDILLLREIPCINDDKSVDFTLLDGNKIKLTPGFLRQKAADIRLSLIHI